LSPCFLAEGISRVRLKIEYYREIIESCGRSKCGFFGAFQNVFTSSRPRNVIGVVYNQGTGLVTRYDLSENLHLVWKILYICIG